MNARRTLPGLLIICLLTIFSCSSPTGGSSSSGSSTVNSNVNVTSVTLNSSTLNTSNLGTTWSLIATVAPSNATNQTLTWNSTNVGVATVSQTGLVTAIGYGSATISATTIDGGVSASCNITVTQPATYTISFNPNGGNGSMSSQSFQAGSVVKLASNTFTNQSLSFIDWNTSKDGSGTSYYKQAVFSPPSGSFTLYAQWGDQGRLTGTHQVTFTATGVGSFQAGQLSIYMDNTPSSIQSSLDSFMNMNLPYSKTYTMTFTGTVGDSLFASAIDFVASGTATLTLSAYIDGVLVGTQSSTSNSAPGPTLFVNTF